MAAERGPVGLAVGRCLRRLPPLRTVGGVFPTPELSTAGWMGRRSGCAFSLPRSASMWQVWPQGDCRLEPTTHCLGEKPRARPSFPRRRRRPRLCSRPPSRHPRTSPESHRRWRCAFPGPPWRPLPRVSSFPRQHAAAAVVSVETEMACTPVVPQERQVLGLHLDPRVLLPLGRQSPPSCAWFALFLALLQHTGTVFVVPIWIKPG